MAQVLTHVGVEAGSNTGSIKAGSAGPLTAVSLAAWREPLWAPTSRKSVDPKAGTSSRYAPIITINSDRTLK